MKGLRRCAHFTVVILDIANVVQMRRATDRVPLRIRRNNLAAWGHDRGGFGELLDDPIGGLLQYACEIELFEDRGRSLDMWLQPGTKLISVEFF